MNCLGCDERVTSGYLIIRGETSTQETMFKAIESVGGLCDDCFNALESGALESRTEALKYPIKLKLP